MVRSFVWMLLLSGHSVAWLSPPSTRIIPKSRSARQSFATATGRHWYASSHPTQRRECHQDGRISVMLKQSQRPLETATGSRSGGRIFVGGRILTAAAISFGLLAPIVLYPKAAFAVISATSSTIADAAASTAITETATVAASTPAAVAATAAAAAATTTTQSMAACHALPRVIQLQLSLRLLYASLFGSVVGWERSTAVQHNHSAGVRTMALVSLGASAFTVCSMYGFLGTTFDASRMAASVASGVGFIGAGVITTHNLDATSKQNFPHSVVHGISTAAAIWISAAVGVACGVGLYYIAGTAALATVSILRLGRVQKRIQKSRREQSPVGTRHDDDEAFISSPNDMLPEVQRIDPTLLETLLQKETRDKVETCDEALLQTHGREEKTDFFAKQEATKRRQGDDDTDPLVQDFQHAVLENKTTSFLPPNSNMTSVVLWGGQNNVDKKEGVEENDNDDPELIKDLQKELSTKTVENQTVIAS